MSQNLHQKITTQFNLHPVITSILLKRGALNVNNLHYFLYGGFYSSLSPFALLGLKESTDFIKEGINTKKAFYIIGDKDVDGVTSISILKIFFERLGLKVYYNLPLHNESYGMSPRMVADIISKKDEIHCIITVDCGIKENVFIEELNDNGVITIVTDHHTPGDEIPNAFAIINPHLNEGHFFPLCGAALALKLVQALFISFSNFYGIKVFCISKNTDSTTYKLGIADDIFSPFEHTDECESLLDLLEYTSEYERFIVITSSSLEKEIIELSFETPPYKIITPEKLYSGYFNKQSFTLQQICEKEKIYYNKSNILSTLLLLTRKIICKYSLCLKEKLSVFLEYAAIATICDRSKLNHHENRSIVRKGLVHLTATSSPLVYVLPKSTSYNQLIEQDIPLRIGPLLNAAGRMGKANIAVDFLSSPTIDEKEKNFGLLKQLNNERQKLQQYALEEIKTHLGIYKEVNEKSYFLFKSPNITKGVTSIIANRLSKELLKPVFIIAIDTGLGIGVGSARCSTNVGIHPILEGIRDLFIAFGGHYKACGFSIEVEKIPLLEEYLNNLDFNTFIDENKLNTNDEVISIPVNLIDNSFFDSYNLLMPFGEENPVPVFKSTITLQNIQIFGKTDNHIKIISQENPGLEFIAWGKAHTIKELESLKTLEVTFTLTYNNYSQGKAFYAVIINEKESFEP